MEDNETPIASPRKYSGAALRYREERRIKQRKERKARKATERVAYLENLKTLFFVGQEAQ